MWNEIITSKHYEVLIQTYDKIIKQYTVQLHEKKKKKLIRILGTFQVNLHISRLWNASLS